MSENLFVLPFDHSPPVMKQPPPFSAAGGLAMARGDDMDMDTSEKVSRDEIVNDLASKNWPTRVEEQNVQVDLVTNIYDKYIKGSDFDSRRLQSFEMSGYLEYYLWPGYGKEGTDNKSYLMSIILMVNSKMKERLPAWIAFRSHPDHFGQFFSRVSALLVDDDLSITERTSALIFWSHSINSIEEHLIRQQIQRYTSLPIWINLTEKRRESEFKQTPKLKKYWNALIKKDKALAEGELEKVLFERKFLFRLIKLFYQILDSFSSQEEKATLNAKEGRKVRFCEHIIDLLIDIESLLQTRRFVNVLLDDMHVVVHCRKSNLFHRPVDGKLFNQLLDVLVFYTRFEIDDFTGEALSEKQMLEKNYDRMFDLQKMIFQMHPEEMKQFYFSNISSVNTRQQLIKHFDCLSQEQLRQICVSNGLLGTLQESENCEKSILVEIIAFVYEKFTSQLQTLNEFPLYPTEEVIWDENMVPLEHWSGDRCLPLPKLNLQFLTLQDYLLRNFHLFRLEATYEIRKDIEDAVYRMKPYKHESGGYFFGGWARMALSIDTLLITQVKSPNLGDKYPSKVKAEVRVNLNVRKEVKREWESLRKHDVCFLIHVRPHLPPGSQYHYNEDFRKQVGLQFVRGCEIEGLLDSHGNLIDETTNEKPSFDTDFRTFRVILDGNQYGRDVEKFGSKFETFYEGFNIIVRRKPEENNFKAVLETIRDLMNVQFVVPDWLNDVLLGFGDPASANYTNLSNQLKTLDYKDTFIDMSHLKSSFPHCNIELKGPPSPEPPFKVTFDDNDKLIVTPYSLPNRGPYPSEAVKKNAVKFTQKQVQAITSGMQPGLTLIVGPPGTGKTDVAVQIISNLYHNFPDQRTVIVTHSNQALNQIFEKLIKLDIDERHLLRLGHGEEALETEKDFTRYGRVNYVLSKRIELLAEVQRLADSLDLSIDAGYTCETAGFFFLYHIFSRWEEYMSKLSEQSTPQDIANLFPFKKFFQDAPEPLFKGNSYEEDLEIARGCYRYIKKIFTQLDEFKAFEMLRTGSERSKYLLIREAKIIAMTCTHAALKRKELAELGFHYDNILMEESAQILEIETFIPLLLQNPEHGHNRLKRWIMIGDHNQLPPVVKNMALQKYCNMEQSLFSRLVRSGVPTIDLNAQGRAKPSLCDLYRWRYKDLGDLEHIRALPEFSSANLGFKYDYQLVNVEDFNGVGESEPVPHYYQNLAEAEFVVATYMYMRFKGYPADRITILTTYNGQKSLLKDVVATRCGPWLGEPSKITTVDKYQGSQNDFILLSLVRTKSVGHIRNVARLIVSVSRARLGLYIFGRVSLFSRCHELSPVMKQLLSRPTKLQLIPDETEKVFEIDSMPEMVKFVFNMKRPVEIEERITQAKAPAESVDKPVEDEVEYEVIGDNDEVEYEVIGDEEMNEPNQEQTLS